MVNAVKKNYQSMKTFFLLPNRISEYLDQCLINQGVLLSSNLASKRDYRSLADLEFKIFSQFGDDGIIQYLTQNIQCEYRTFIEFGVGDYFESNTRFLLQKDNWSGFVMDSSPSNIERIKKAPFYWKYALNAQAAFITKENIMELLSPYIIDWGGVDLLHIDLDGNDYWVWKAIEIKPTILILEYNSIFGFDRAITVPYNANFDRTAAHFSNLYWGASLKALYDLSIERGYTLIGCNSAGNNAYFLRKDKMNESVKEVSLKDGFVLSKYRESRDKSGALTYLGVEKGTEMIRGLPVFNIDSQMIEEF